jgi:phosphoribosylformylglycinamidine cyclo-ligase
MGGLTYSKSGVDLDRAAAETGALGKILAATLRFRPGTGASVLDIGYYANAIRITEELAIGVCTDGVGTKVLVAEQMGKFDTLGIDCVAVNVNDLVCIGAEPLCMLDYIAVERLQPGALAEIAKGLVEGARQANISIPGGETAQLPEVIRGAAPGKGLDLVGMAVGLVPIANVNCGRDVEPGDLVLGLRSSGLHSNGLTLARRVLLGEGGFTVGTHRPELGRTVGEAMLEPTRIYVREAMDLWNSGLAVKALLHISGDGLLNLNRVAAEVSWEIDAFPPLPPLFRLIQETGKVDVTEMFRVFNMGVGFCAVVAPGDAPAALALLAKHGTEAQVIGRAVKGAGRTVGLPQFGIVGRDTDFHRT